VGGRRLPRRGDLFGVDATQAPLCLRCVSKTTVRSALRPRRLHKRLGAAYMATSKKWRGRVPRRRGGGKTAGHVVMLCCRGCREESRSFDLRARAQDKPERDKCQSIDQGGRE